MLLSICIPTYNNDIGVLLEALAVQAEGHEDVEIVCIDDHSDHSYYEINSNVADKIEKKGLCKIKYIYLPENVGRSRIRNLFLQYVDAEYMQFLDCDATIENHDFVANCLSAIQEKPDVVCGGWRYEVPCDRAHKLRLKYAEQRECRDIATRSSEPYRSFQTGNFMIRRSLLSEIRFDESIVGYGHEDTLFGFRLRQRNAHIAHIDNPAVSRSIDNNATFVAKSEQAVENLKKIYFEILKSDKDFAEEVALIRCYEKLRSKRLLWLVRASFFVLRRPSKFILCQGFASVNLFSYYKLGLMCR